MKIVIPIVLAGIALALCGCTTADGPVFSSDATKPSGTTAGPDATEQARDVNNYYNNNNMNMGAGVNGNGATGAPPGGAMAQNPYGH